MSCETLTELASAAPVLFAFYLLLRGHWVWFLIITFTCGIYLH